MVEVDRILDAFISARGRHFKLVRGMVPPKDVEDIVQETYVRICQVEKKSPIRDPQAFMLRTARNLALDHLKRAETRLTEGVGDIDDVAFSALDTTYTQAVSDQDFALLCEAIRELPRQSRRAFVLKKVYGYSLKEIMVEMNLGQPTIETHIVNATKKCVQYMRERNSQNILKKDSKSSRNDRIDASRGRSGGAL